MHEISKQILKTLIILVNMSLSVIPLSMFMGDGGSGSSFLPWLHTAGKYIKDESGQIVILHGVSLDIRDITNTTMFKRFMRVSVEETVSLIKGLGAGIVRLAVDGGLWARSDYVELVDAVVSSSASAGMYVAVDFHKIGDQWDVQEKADMIMNVTSQRPVLDFWDSVAQRYKDQSAVLYGSILNEPWKGNYSLNAVLVAWYKFALKISRRIHAVNPRALILVGTLNNKNKTMLYFDRNPLPEPNVVYVWHDYYANDLYFPSRRFQYALDYAAGNISVARAELVGFVKNAALFMRRDYNLPILMEEFGSAQYYLDRKGNTGWYPVPNWDVEIQHRYILYKSYKLSWIQWMWKRDTQTGFGLLKDDGRTLNAQGELLATNINIY